MIKGQIFRDLYALDWMRANRSPAIESYSRDLTAYRARDKWFQALPKVGLSLSMPWSGTSEYGVIMKDQRSLEKVEQSLLCRVGLFLFRLFARSKAMPRQSGQLSNYSKPQVLILNS